LQETNAPSGAVKKYYYDNLNRSTKLEEIIGGQTFATQYEYDMNNNIIGYTYPSGFKTEIVYNTIGFLTLIKNANNNTLLWRADEQNCFGLNKYTLGNGIQTSKTHTNFGNLTNVVSGNIFNHSYNFNVLNGNLNSLTDNIKSLKETFLYDGLDRLTSSTVGDLFAPTQPALTLTYGNNGNITNKSDVGDYKYLAPKPNAVQFVKNPNNIISQITQDITYNGFDKPTVIIEGNESATVIYNSSQDRVKVDYTNTSTNQTYSRYYLSDYETEVKNGITRQIHYINSPSGLVAMHVIENGIANTYYVYGDHLGSLKTITNSSGNIVAEQNFDPWGQRRNPSTWAYANVPALPNWLYRGYTGHEHLPQFSLINMNGRLYDPQNGRMLNVDPVLQAPLNSQNYNKYSYCLNNPLKYTDPSGYSIFDGIDFGGFFAGLAGAKGGQYGRSNYTQSQIRNTSQPYMVAYSTVAAKTQIQMASILIGGGVAGSISTAYAGVGAGFIGTTIGGGVAGGINGFGAASISGENVGQGFVNGAISGLAAGAVGAGLGAIAPGFSNASLAGRYAGKALYAGLTGAAVSGAGMFAGDLADNGRIDLSGKDYLRGLGVGAAMGAVISLGYSAYDYTTWDRFSPTDKVNLLNKEFNTSVLQYDSTDPNYGGYTWGDSDIKLGDAALANRSIARNTVAHEFQHYNDYFNGVPFNRINLEQSAHLLDLRLATSQGLPGRYWTESRYFLRTNYGYKGKCPNTYGPGQLWFNIFR
jgi:RHS repeat-associated protein